MIRRFYGGESGSRRRRAIRKPSGPRSSPPTMPKALSLADLPTPWSIGGSGARQSPGSGEDPALLHILQQAAIDKTLGEGPLFRPGLTRLRKVCSPDSTTYSAKALIENLAWAQTFQLNLGSEFWNPCAGRDRPAQSRDCWDEGGRLDCWRWSLPYPAFQFRADSQKPAKARSCHPVQ